MISIHSIFTKIHNIIPNKQLAKKCSIQFFQMHDKYCCASGIWHVTSEMLQHTETILQILMLDNRDCALIVSVRKKIIYYKVLVYQPHHTQASFMYIHVYLDRLELIF